MFAISAPEGKKKRAEYTETAVKGKPEEQEGGSGRRGKSPLAESGNLRYRKGERGISGMRDWAEGKREFLERDLVRDFFLFVRDLEEQFRRFEESATVSYPALHHLVGDTLSKGLLWRVKDNAQLLFRPSPVLAGRLLDWTLGYIFHESLKLLEDARLRQSYIPRLADLQRETIPDSLADLLAGFSSIRIQTRESIEREVNRLKILISLTISLLRHYFAGRRDHRPLARFLYDHNDLARTVLKGEYASLLAAVYGDCPGTMYREAAESLLQSARRDEALAALSGALACSPCGPEAEICRRRLEEISGMAAASAPPECGFVPQGA